MFVKFLYWIGILACVVLMVSCFLPWVYYADIGQHFTGFYSYQNEYGKPGKLLVTMSAVTMSFMLIPKVWAKRANLFISALVVAYAVKTYILFSSCYNNYCPQKLFSIYLMLCSTVVMLLASIFPKLSVKDGG